MEILQKNNMDKMTIYDHEFKILLMGEDEGSKTAFVKRYCYNFFNPSERLTIGVDFHVKTIELNDLKIKLQIWDVGGEERFRNLLPTYCLGADGAFYLYDITSRLSLEHLPESIQLVRKSAGDIPMMLVGSKFELSKSSRQVPRDYGIHIAKENKMASFVEVSAKENINVDEAFKVLTELILEKTNKPLGDKDDDDFFPHPYIFKPPSPPDDIAPTGQQQLMIPITKKKT